MERPQIPVKNVLDCFRSEVHSLRSYENLKKMLDSFKFSEDDDIVPLYFMIIDEPERFKDRSNYPKSWKQDSSRKAGISAINRSINISLVKSKLDKEQIDFIRTKLSQFMIELGGQSSSINQVTDDDMSSMIEDDVENTDNENLYIQKIKKLQDKNNSLIFKLDTMMQYFKIAVKDNEQAMATFALFNETLDKLLP